MSGQEDPIEQVARLIWWYRFNLMHAPFVNDGGWPLADGSRVVLAADELDRAIARSIEMRGRERPPKYGQPGGPRPMPPDTPRRES